MGIDLHVLQAHGKVRPHSYGHRAVQAYPKHPPAHEVIVDDDAGPPDIVTAIPVNAHRPFIILVVQ